MQRHHPRGLHGELEARVRQGIRPMYSDSGTLSVAWKGRNALSVTNQSGKNHRGAYTPDSRFCAKIRISIAALLRTVQKHSWSRTSRT